MSDFALENSLSLPQYDPIIAPLVEHKYVVLDDFLNLDEVIALRQRLFQLQAEDEFKKAGVGSAENFTVERMVRGDYIHWIEADQAVPVTLLFLRKLYALMACLNQHLFLSLKDFESHFTYYPVGTAYQRHLDQFQNNLHRKMSFVCYLNPNWQDHEGGQLKMYLAQDQDFDILPQAGRLVLFKSDELEHEVIAASRERYSITGWFLDQFHDLTFL